MTELKTRSEKHAEEIENFLESNSNVMVLLLYGNEIKKLEKRFPILITKGEQYGDLHNCFIYKKHIE